MARPAPALVTQAMADTEAVGAATPAPISTVAPTPTPVPTVLPPLVAASAGTVVISATVAASGTFFYSTHVNGLRIGLRVPLGAVHAPTMFRVSLAGTAPPAARTCPGSGGVGLGNKYSFSATQVNTGAAIYAFSQPLFIRLDVPPGNLSLLKTCTIMLAYLHSGSWVAVPIQHVDGSTGAVTGFTTHFTIFQVRAVARAQPRHARIPSTPAARSTLPPLLPPTATPTAPPS